MTNAQSTLTRDKAIARVVNPKAITGRTTLTELVDKIQQLTGNRLDRETTQRDVKWQLNQLGEMGLLKVTKPTEVFVEPITGK